MSDAAPAPAPDNHLDARERAHRVELAQMRRLREERALLRAQFQKEKTVITETWHRLLAVRQGESRDVRRATLNLLEDTEFARHREEQEAAGRVRAEAAQQVSDARYRTLFESIDEGFCIVEVLFAADGRTAVDYRFEAANPAFARHTGLGEVVGRTMRELVPAHEEHWFETYGRIARTGAPARFEERAAALGRDYDVYAFRIGEPGENRVAVLFNDISERKRVEAALRASEARQSFLVRLNDALRPLSAALQIEATAAELLGAHLHVNLAHYAETAGEFVQIHQGYGDGLLPLTGRFRAEELGPRLIAGFRAGKVQVCADVAADSIFASAQRQVLAAARIGAFIAVPLVKNHAWVATLAVHNIQPRAWTRDEVELVQEVAERTWAAAERARAQDALRGSEEQFRRAIEDAPIPVIMHAEDGQVLQISRTWTELTGFTQQDIPTFEAWLNHAYGFGAETVRDRMRGVFRHDRASEHFELQITTRSGETRDWIFTISTPGRLLDGRRFAVGMVIDLTERMRAERDLRASEERLREADRRKNDFLAMLGHELRNPLAAIRGGLALLSSEKTQPATRARTLPIVTEQVAHMERLIEDLLDVTRIVTGRVQLQPERVSVQAILRTAVEMLRATIDSGGFDLQQHVAPEPLTVHGDPVRLNQVVVNVLGNALKYSGSARTIELSAVRAADAAVITIRDYGEGIAAELLPRVFDPFVQAKPTLTRGEGLGLGLAVARQLVELHGGRVEAFSAGERQGSKFVIHLPLAADVG